MNKLSKYLEIVTEQDNKYLYHVTLTKNVPKIKKNGILLLQTTNWTNKSGERYGKGEIYAFENFTDAVKWGAKMEWDFKTKKPEEISIVKFIQKGKWKIDEHDPLGQAGKKGSWMHSTNKVDPEDIIAVKVLTRGLIRKFVADEDLTNDFQ